MRFYLFVGFVVVFILVVIVPLYVLFLPLRAFLYRFIFKSHKRRFTEIESELSKLVTDLQKRREHLVSKLDFGWSPVYEMEPPESAFAGAELPSVRSMESRVHEAISVFKES